MAITVARHNPVRADIVRKTRLFCRKRRSIGVLDAAGDVVVLCTSRPLHRSHTVSVAVTDILLIY